MDRNVSNKWFRLGKRENRAYLLPPLLRPFAPSPFYTALCLARLFGEKVFFSLCPLSLALSCCIGSRKLYVGSLGKERPIATTFVVCKHTSALSVKSFNKDDLLVYE